MSETTTKGRPLEQHAPLRHCAGPRPPDALIDLLDWKASLHPRGEAARDFGCPPAQGHLRADGALAEVDGAGPLRTCHVPGERDRSRPRWGSVAATLDLGPQIENLREAELDRVPRRLWLKRSRHRGQLSRGRVATSGGDLADHRGAGRFEGPADIQHLLASPPGIDPDRPTPLGCGSRRCRSRTSTNAVPCLRDRLYAPTTALRHVGVRALSTGGCLS
jgi:hypothetical protein